VSLAESLVSGPILCQQNQNPTPSYSGIVGDICSTNSECSGTNAVCQSNVCRIPSAVLNTFCNTLNDCDLGYYCDVGHACLKVIAIGGQCIETATPQDPNGMCGFNAFCINSKCVTLFSLPNQSTLPFSAPSLC